MISALSTAAGFCLSAISLSSSCSAPKPKTPALTPQEAAALLHYSAKAENWMLFVKKQDASCSYKVDLPDQTSHPSSIDLSHIVSCGNRPSPKEFDASVSFEFDPTAQKWVLSRFSS
jgi:hypothetical protein